MGEGSEDVGLHARGRRQGGTTTVRLSSRCRREERGEGDLGLGLWVWVRKEICDE